MSNSDLEYERTEYEPDSELESDPEDESEQSPMEGPHLTGVRLSEAQEL